MVIEHLRDKHGADASREEAHEAVVEEGRSQERKEDQTHVIVFATYDTSRFVQSRLQRLVPLHGLQVVSLDTGRGLPSSSRVFVALLDSEPREVQLDCLQTRAPTSHDTPPPPCLHFRRRAFVLCSSDVSKKLTLPRASTERYANSTRVLRV